MRTTRLWQTILKRLLRRHGNAKSFDSALKEQSAVVGITDRGTGTVPTEKIVGSVSRWRNLRTDFFYRHGQAVTQRFLRIGMAMKEGKALPPLELYKVKGSRQRGSTTVDVSEYYVVDGHHRVAMAKQLGQDFMDAHVVEYQVSATGMPEPLADGESAAIPDRPAGDGSDRSSTPPAADAEHKAGE